MARPVGRGREQLERLRAGVDRGESFARGREAGRDLQASLHGMGNQRRPRVRRDDEPAAGLGEGIDLVLAQHRAAADQGARAELRGDGADAGAPVGRIERDLDRVEAGIDQRLHMGDRFLGPDAAQDRDQRESGRPVHKDVA